MIIFLIVGLAPTHKDVEEDDDDRTDDYIAPRIIFLIIIMLSALLSVLKITDFYFGVNLQARRVESKIEDEAIAEAIDRARRESEFPGGEDEDEQLVAQRAPEEIINNQLPPRPQTGDDTF